MLSLSTAAIYLFLILELGSFYVKMISIVNDSYNLKGFVTLLIEFIILTVKVYLFYTRSLVFLFLTLLGLTTTMIYVLLDPTVSNRTEDYYLQRVLVSPDRNIRDAAVFDATCSLILFLTYFVNNSL